MGMFFIFGIAPGRKVLNFQQTIICQNCGSYGRYEVMMTYMALSIFFIPIAVYFIYIEYFPIL